MDIQQPGDGPFIQTLEVQGIFHEHARIGTPGEIAPLDEPIIPEPKYRIANQLTPRATTVADSGQMEILVEGHRPAATV
jgi:hypothetical protein